MSHKSGCDRTIEGQKRMLRTAERENSFLENTNCRCAGIRLSVGMPKLQWQAAFFAGYSIDSVTALFLGQFETTGKTKTQELTGESKKPEAEEK